MLRKFMVCFVLLIVMGAFFSDRVLARDRIVVVGSSTVFTFAAAVAERFGRSSGFSTPLVEFNGTGRGIDLLCSGIGDKYPDIANASRRITESEKRLCQTSGISLIEITIGRDGIVIANSTTGLKWGGLTRKQIYQALARRVPIEGKLVNNPYRTWQDLDSSLPNVKIGVFGPPSTSGTRDSLIELAMGQGAREFPSLRALEKDDSAAFQALIRDFRDDGGFIEVGENDNLVLQKLSNNSNMVGILSFSLLDQNGGKIRGLRIDGVEPDFEHITSGAYVLSRPLYIYIKKEHVAIIPGLRDYIAEFTSEAAGSEDGYMAERGLITLSPDEREEMRARARNLTPMDGF